MINHCQELVKDLKKNTLFLRMIQEEDDLKYLKLQINLFVAGFEA